MGSELTASPTPHALMTALPPHLTVYSVMLTSSFPSAPPHREWQWEEDLEGDPMMCGQRATPWHRVSAQILLNE